MSHKPKIVFLGTPEFARPTLKILLKNGLRPELVITQPDKPVGRTSKIFFSPIKQLALAEGLNLFQPKGSKELIEIFSNQKFEVAILVAFSMIIPSKIINKPKFGFLNLHPSLLPKYRGPSPIQQALLNGDDKSGVSIIKLEKEIDAGPIIAQQEVTINLEDNAETLHTKLAKVGAELMLKILPGYLAKSAKIIPQDNSKATYTKIINRQDALVDWKKTAWQINLQFRAFFPWPGVFTNLDGKRLKILNLSVLEGDFEAVLIPGMIFLGPRKELMVKCGKGALELKTIQIEGKKKLLGKDFLHGQKNLIGKILN